MVQRTQSQLTQASAGFGKFGPQSSATKALRQSTAAKAERAKKRAARCAGEDLFSGQEAVEEVSREDGAWNWVFLSPAQFDLPLSGGGSGGLKEMKSAVGKEPLLCGLLRMKFVAGERSTTLWVYVNARDSITSGNFTARERGKAMMMASSMEQAISEIANFTAKVDLEGTDECTVELFLEKLRQVQGVDHDMLTEEHLEGFKPAASPVGEAQVVPRALVQDAEPEIAPVKKAEEAPARLRVPTKLPNKGDLVEVHSSSHDKWFPDGEIVAINRDACQVGGLSVMAGSVKVVFDKGKRFKWVGPAEVGGQLRASPLPRPPDALSGTLGLESPGWFITSWVEYYFELQKGYLQYWPTVGDAMGGAKPTAAIHLQGLRQLKMEMKGTKAILRLRGATGVVYGFKVPDETLAQRWVESIWAQAAYCDEQNEFELAQWTAKQMRRELLRKAEK